MTAPAWTLSHVPVAPFAAPRTAVAPGIQPLDPADWIHLDDDFAGQMALRDDLILNRPHWATAMTPEGEAPAAELLEALSAHLATLPGYARERMPQPTAAGANPPSDPAPEDARPPAPAPSPDPAHSTEALRRPDGALVPLEGPPIATAGRLSQDDLLVMLKPEGAAEHVLVAGVLCFPAHWTLSEKIGRPLLRIHRPVPEYPGDLAARVQRLFDGVKPGHPLWRANWHFAASPDIVTPMHEAEKTAAFASRLAPGEDAWLRVERQTVLRLPRTGAVVFGVRTLISPTSALTPAQWAALNATLAELPGDQGARKLGPALRARAAREAAQA